MAPRWVGSRPQARAGESYSANPERASQVPCCSRDRAPRPAGNRLAPPLVKRQSMTGCESPRVGFAPFHSRPEEIMRPVSACPVRIPSLAIAIALLVLTPHLVFAALPPDGARGPRPIAPAADATVAEPTLRFAWQAPANTERHFLLVSRAPFETRDWTALPTGGEVQVVEVKQPVASLDDLRLKLDQDTRLYWAAAAIEAGTNRLSIGPVSTNFVLRRFANRITPSPYLQTSPIGAAARRAA